MAVVFGDINMSFWVRKRYGATTHFLLVLIYVSFSVTGYDEIKKQTSNYQNVYYEETTVCNRGRARYLLGMAPTKKFPVSDMFAAAVCTLPETYDHDDYFDFVERWGTVSVRNLFFLRSHLTYAA